MATKQPDVPRGTAAEWRKVSVIGKSIGPLFRVARQLSVPPRRLADVYVATNDRVFAVWQRAGEILGPGQREIPNLAEPEFMPEMPNVQSLLAHRRRLYRQGGWL